MTLRPFSLRRCLAVWALLAVLTLAVGQAGAAQLAYAPVSGQMSSSFGWRSDPIQGGSRFHAGVDIAAPQGAPVYAPQNGRVVYSGVYGGYGNVVVIDHGFNFYTLYGHLSSIYVGYGQPVQRGQAIAAVGSTGRSTGPHLHFETHQNGQYVDPLNYLAYLARQGQNQGLALAHAAPARYATTSYAAARKNAQPLTVSVARASNAAPAASESAEESQALMQSLSQYQAARGVVANKAADAASDRTAEIALATPASQSAYRLQVGSAAAGALRSAGRKAVQIVQGNRVRTVKF